MNFSNFKNILFPLVLDGAIGSYLENKFPSQEKKYLWMNNFNSTEEEKWKFLYQLYEEYVQSGAQIITSNTFSTHLACYFRSDQNENKNFYDEEYFKLSEENSRNAIEFAIIHFWASFSSSCSTFSKYSILIISVSVLF